MYRLTYLGATAFVIVIGFIFYNLWGNVTNLNEFENKQYTTTTFQVVNISEVKPKEGKSYFQVVGRLHNSNDLVKLQEAPGTLRRGETIPVVVLEKTYKNGDPIVYTESFAKEGPPSFVKTVQKMIPVFFGFLALLTFRAVIRGPAASRRWRRM